MLFDDPTLPTVAMNADEFDFGWETGYFLSMIAHKGVNGADFEFRYLDVDWSDSQFLAVTGSPVRVNTATPLTFGGPRDITSVYDSELSSYQFLLRQSLDARTKLTGGFRYLQLDEALRTNLVSTSFPAGTDEIYNVFTSNNLYGLDLGLETLLYSSCDCCLEGFLRGGAFANDADQNSALRTAVGDNSGSDTSFAYVLEAGLTGTWSLCQNLNLRAEYLAMYIDGVALASDQIPTTSFPAGGLTTDGDVFVHGGTLGLEFVF